MSTKLKSPENENYAATVVTITKLIKLENCDNVQHTVIFGNYVIVGKDVQLGDRGMYFPAETQLSKEFLYHNDLYKHNTLNKNIDKKGYFEDNGRIKCLKFRGHRSEGLFMPLESLDFVGLIILNILDTFDTINDVEICRKYIPKNIRTPGTSNRDKRIPKKVCRIVPNQFRFHSETSQLGKNIWKLKPNSRIHISNKLHGTSFVVGKLLCYKKEFWLKKIFRSLFRIPRPTHYDIIYSSRNVIKNDDLNKNYNHFYQEDVWSIIAQMLAKYLDPGMTVYGEAVGFTPTGKSIQKGYDYDCGPNEMKIFIYKITTTIFDGNPIVWDQTILRNWCNIHGLRAVPEFYNGTAEELHPCDEVENIEDWQQKFLSKLQSSFNLEKDCVLCFNKVPAEGIVILIEDEAFKLKSFRFKEHETKALDRGEIDLETEESISIS